MSVSATVGDDEKVYHVASKKFRTGPVHGATDVDDPSDAYGGSTGNNDVEKAYPGVASRVQEIEKMSSHPQDQWQRFGRSTTYTFRNLDGGTQHSVKVKCVCVDESVSEPVETKAYTKPSPVKPCEPECSDSSIRLNWEFGPGNTETVAVTLMSDNPDVGPKRMTKKETNVLFEGLNPGTTYRYEIKTVSGDQENISQGHVTTKLCAPGNLKPKQQGANAIELSWTPPANLEKVSGYIITYFVKGASESEQAKQIDGVSVTRYQLTDLSDDREYEVSIRSFGGTRDFPLKSDSIAAKPIKTEVASVNNPEVRTYTHGSIEVRWEKRKSEWLALPSWMKKQKRELKVSISKVSDPNSHNSPTIVDDRKVTHHPFMALQPSTEYEISFDVVGASSNKRTTLKQWTRPLPLNRFQVVQKTTQSIQCEWVPPSCRFDGYIVSISAVGDMLEPNEIPLSGDHKTYMFESLSPGQQYIVLIETVLKVGADRILSEYRKLDVSTLPMVPRNVRVENVMDESVSVKWDIPERGQVDCYRVYLKPKNRDPIYVQGLTYKFNHLKPLTKYDICVQSIRGEDSSELTEYVSCTTKPSEVKSLRVGPVSYDKLTIVWDQVCNQAEYDVKIDPAEGTMNDRKLTDSSASFYGLTPGKKYTVTVVTKVGEDLSKPSTKSFWAQVKPVDKIYINEEDVTTSSIYVSWDEPEGVVDDYLISPGWAVETASKEVKASDTSVQFQDPMQGPEYIVTIFSMSGDQQSKPVTKEYQLPLSIPTKVKAMPSDTSIELEWDSIRPGDKRYRYRLSVVPRHKDASHQLEVAEEGTSSTNGDKVQGEDEMETSDEIADLDAPEASSSSDVPGQFVDVPNSRSDRLSYTFYSLTPGVEYEVKVKCLSPTLLVDDAIESKSAGSGQESVVIPYYESQPCSVSVRTTPAAPEDIMINENDVHPTSIRISWPDAKGNVENYQVSIRGEKRTQCAQTTTVTKTAGETLSYAFEKLVAGGQYIIEIKSVNKGDESAPVQKTQQTPPLPPTDLKVDYVKHSKSIRLTWKAPEGERDLYLVEADPKTDEDMSITVDKNKTSCTIPNVVPGEKYTISVWTKRGNLCSEKSTVPFQVPVSEVKNIETKEVHAKTITVSWEEAEGKKTGYRLCIDPKDGLDEELAKKAEQGDLFHRFTELEPGRLYTISIITLCGEVESEAVMKTQRTKISPVAEITTDGGVRTTSIRIKWRKPEGDQDKYRVAIYKSSEEVNRGAMVGKHHVFPSSSDLDYTFEKLCPGRQYIITVESGCGDDWSDETTKVQRTTVCPVSNLQVSNITGVSFKMSWMHAVGDKDSYRVRVRTKLDESDNAWETIPVPKDQSYYDLDKLTQGREYSVGVITVSGEEKSDPVPIVQRTEVAPVIGLCARSSKEGQLEIKWKEAVGDKDHYICTIDGHSSRRIPKDKNETVLTGLVPGEKYRITLVTVSGGVKSVEVPCCQRVMPCPPKLHVKSKSTLETIAVTWEDSVKDCVKDHYEVKLHPAEDPQTEVIPPDITKDNKYQFTGLLPGTQYQVSVCSISEDQRSKEDLKIVTTEVSKPVIRSIKAEESKIEIELDEPNGNVENYIWKIQESDNNSQVEEISVNVRDESSSNNDVLTLLQKSVQKRGPSSGNLLEENVETDGARGNHKLCLHPVMFPRLKPCKQYSIAVRAESSGKKSDHEQVYQHTRPHRPRKPECGNEGMNNFSVFWSPPQTEEERGRIVGYRVKFRRVTNNLATIEEVGEDDWKWLDPGNTTQQKIDETNADNTDYEIGIVSVAEIESHKPEDEGRKIKIESEPVRFRYRTMSYGKKFLQNAVLIFVTVVILIAVIIVAVLLAGVYIDKCGNIDPGRDFTFNTNATSPPVTQPPSSSNCLFEKAGTEFWIFILSLVVLTIDVVVLIVWYQVVRKRFARGRMQLLDDEAVDEEEEETTLLQTVVERTRRLLAYLRNMCAATEGESDSTSEQTVNPLDSEDLESVTDSESDSWDKDEYQIPSSFKRRRVTTIHSTDGNTNTEGEGTSPKALLLSEESEDISTDDVENDQENLVAQIDIADDSVIENPTVNRESPSENSHIVTVKTVEEDEDWEDDYMSPLAYSIHVMDNQTPEDSAVQQDVESEMAPFRNELFPAKQASDDTIVPQAAPPPSSTSAMVSRTFTFLSALASRKDTVKDFRDEALIGGGVPLSK
ncbi:PTPRB [Branchiostoma lanceolatum]|uniref:PTPRB protein n=1 Tax=Branchiostoma lanceolatum TaxID=7740 RepID=A0A8K0EK86_BRALA|nr:PTPRB [Branchiostoma lanceolatum]